MKGKQFQQMRVDELVSYRVMTIPSRELPQKSIILIEKLSVKIIIYLLFFLLHMHKGDILSETGIHLLASHKLESVIFMNSSLLPDSDWKSLMDTKKVRLLSIIP